MTSRAAAALAALCLAAAPARAAPRRPAAPAASSEDATAEAKRHFQRATELYRQARYREAIKAFEAAQRLRPHGVLFFNLAQCHERLGEIPEALDAYREYVRLTPDAKDRDLVHAAMINLEARLGAAGAQQLIVNTEPPGAEVQVDGQLRGKTPFSVTLPLGSHQLAATLADHEPERREVELSPDRSLQLELVLRRSPPPAPQAPAAALALSPALPPALSPAARAAAPLVDGRTEIVKQAPPRRLWTWVAGGAAVAAVAAGVGFGLAANGASDELRGSVHDAATAQQLADTASSRARTANVLYGVAAAAAAAGVTLYFLEGAR